MAKFSLAKFPAGFFDVTQDISGALPVDIIDRWAKGPQSRDAARQLLQPSEVHGIVVSSDSAGLTRLSQARGLLEILALIDRPKQLIHAYGAALGGEPVGIWAADNTEMFYPPHIGADAVVSTLLTVQDRVRAECEVQVGFGVHYGRFYRVGGGMYGTEADRVELIAEEYTEGGEIVITAEVAAEFPSASGFALEPRQDLPPELGWNLRVTAGARRSDLTPAEGHYPIPYSHQFYADLLRFANAPKDLQLAQQIHQAYGEERAVVLIERERDETEMPEVAMLNDLALSLAVRKIGVGLLRDLGGKEIKTAGSIGIYTFGECPAALAFAKRFRDVLLQDGIESRTAIAFGEVLVFDLAEGVEDIAGGPVNIASKLAQDVGTLGRIYVTEEAARSARLGSDFHPVSFQISGVSIDAWMD